MRVLKNLLGDGSKIHSDSVFFEIGSNDDGAWMRFAGIQLSWVAGLPTSRVSSSRLTSNWLYPKEYVSVPFVFPTVIGETVGGLTRGGSPIVRARSTASTSLAIETENELFGENTSLLMGAFAIGFY